MKRYDVLAIGELNVDMIMTGMKSMPVPGREILAESCQVVLGSSTAICASGIARLGLVTGFLGKLGNDDFGHVVLRGLAENGILTDEVIIDKHIQTGITVSLSMAQDRALVTCLGSIEALEVSDIEDSVLKNARHIHVGSFYLQNGLRQGLTALFRKAKSLGLTTSLDAGWDESGIWDGGIREVLPYTDLFFPNETEALHITGKDNVNDALMELSDYCSGVVVKCGSRGALTLSGGRFVESPAYLHLKVVDTTGAGDSFNAGFIYGFLKGNDVETCMKYGNACGSISVTRIGGATSCATLDEVNALIQCA